MGKKDPSVKTVETRRTDRYIVGDVLRGRTAIKSFLKCLQCGFTTYNPEDVLYRFCNRCQQWLDQSDHGGLR